MSSRPVWVIGAGGHATSVAEAVVAAGFVLEGFVDEHRPGRTLLDRPVVAELPGGHLAAGGGLVVAIGDNATRRQLAARWDDLPAEAFPAVVHPSASVSRWARVDHGAVVLQRAVVASAARVGAFAVVNTAAVLEHDGDLADHASLAPGSVTGGRVRVGLRSAVCLGALVRQGVTIGDDVVLGAGSYLDRDLPDRVVAYGVPARVVRTRTAADAYL